MEGPLATCNHDVGFFGTLQYYSTAHIEKLHSSLKTQAKRLVEKDATIEQQNQAIEEQRTLNKKLAESYKFEQTHRFRLEAEAAELTGQVRKYEALFEELKDANDWRDMYQSLQQQNNNLLGEKNDLDTAIAQCSVTITSLRDQVSQSEIKVSGLRDEIAYLEAHNLGLRSESNAKEVQHRQENDETANYYKTKLISHEQAVEVLHSLAEQGGEALSIAAYFAQALKLTGVQLCTLGIDEHRADTLFDYVCNSQSSYPATHPQTTDRGFRYKARPQFMPAPAPPFTGFLPTAPPAFPAPLASAAHNTAQPTFTPGQTLNSSPTAQPNTNDPPPPPPPPPFPPSIMHNHQDHDDLDSPFAVDLSGEYLKPAAAKRAEEKIKRWGKMMKKWEKEHGRGCEEGADAQSPTGGAEGRRQTGESMFDLLF